jgi:Fic/DOC family N-terminal
VDIDLNMVTLISDTERALGRLDGTIKTVPDPGFFVAMYVRREAVLSSQIEGTQSTLEDLLAAELGPSAKSVPDDVVHRGYIVDDLLYDPYLALFDEPEPLAADDTQPELTEAPA